MEEAYAIWIAGITIAGVFSMSILGYVCWKDCRTYSQSEYEEVNG